MRFEGSDENKAYEERLQRRLNILKQELEAGKVKIAKGLRVIESLKNVRYAPDGTVDLSTSGRLGSGFGVECRAGP